MPPLARLVAPRSVALQLELVALFAAQHQRAPRSGVVPLRLPVEAPSREEIGWADLVVSASEHNPGAQRVVRASGNRVRQVRSALDRLARTDVSLLELPRAGTRRKYDDAVLLDEGGTRAVGDPMSYRLPRPGEEVVGVPPQFWLNGWVHALTDSEVATWLVFRRLQQVDPDGHDRDGVAIAGDTRLRYHGLSEEAWNSHRMLTRLGLLEAEPGPGRRPDGTLENYTRGTPPPLHRFRVTDEALNQDAVAVVQATISAMLGPSH